MKRRFLSLLCAVAILMGMIIVPANATGTDGDLQDKVNDYTSGVITLSENAENLTVEANTYIDLNGHTIAGVTVSDGATLYVSDSQTDDYTVADGICGAVTGITGSVQAANGYVQIAEEDAVSFHRADLTIKSMSLRPGNAGVYYRSHFAADEVVAARVESYGVALSVAAEPTAENLETLCGYSVLYNFGAGEKSGTLLTGIMDVANTPEENAANAAMDIYGRAYIKTEDGYTFGATVVRDLQEQVEAIDAIFDALTETQKSGILAMYETYKAAMADWNIPNLRGNQLGDTVITVPVQTENGVVTETVTVEKDGVSVTIPFGALVEKAELTLNVTKKAQSDSGIEAAADQTLMPFDVHVDGVSPENTVPLTVYLGKVMPENLNMGNYSIYHVEENGTKEMALVANDEAFTAHNQYKYTLDGELTLHMATFSEVTALADNAAKWENGVDHTWYTENPGATELEIRNADQLWSFSQIVGGMAEDIPQDDFNGKTVKLLADIDLNDAEAENDPDKIFYPIGYNSSDGKYEKTGVAIDSSLKVFRGDFDGNGHTISNFYQNTWEMKGDHYWYDATLQYYRDGMGLFGRIEGSTIKNLTVDNFKCDSEIGTSGTIATYADSTDDKSVTFENIAITNCNPRVYNIGNGGIVGSAGYYSQDVEGALPIILKNITVDDTNTISALWGSYDVGCGGLLGRYYPQAYTDVEYGLSLENCHVAATIDVFNDVCGNYQYYWYRYCGMVVGTVEQSTADGGADLSTIVAKDCTVDFGDRHEYYYCEFMKNGKASYTHDYKFSRVPHEELIFDDTNDNKLVDEDEANTVTGCKHNHSEIGTQVVNGETVLIENNQHVYLPFRQLFGGNGWGIEGVDLGEYPAVDISVATKSEVKFQKAATAQEAYVTGTTVTVGELFAAAEIENKDLSIQNAQVQVFVSPADPDDENNTVGGSYEANTTDWTQGKLTFTGTGTATITITDYYFCTPTTITVDIKPVEFSTKFVNYETYLYRVGNASNSPVALDTMFEANDLVKGVEVDVKTVAGDASGTYTPNETWTNGTIQFSGTGVVKVIISATNANSKDLYLEVVDAVNATSKTDVTANDVVLLKDISGGFTVSNGWTLYGNGFKATCSGDGSYRSAAVSYGFVTVEKGGVLDNVQIICDIFPESYIYTSEMKAGTDGRYPYGYSAVVVSGNSTISNCYIYGARNNIQVGDGNVVIENTVTECGSLSNIHIKSGDAYTVTLDNVTTIQYRTTSVYDNSKTVLGFGVIVGDNESTSNAKIILKGDLKQYNWVTDADSNVSNTYAKQAISSALKETDYQYTIDEKITINMGIVYLNQLGSDRDDQRSNKDTIPYKHSQISISGITGSVYSVEKGSTEITLESRYSATTDLVIPYVANASRDVPASIAYADTTSSAVTMTTAYSAPDGRWETKFVADLDNISGGSYVFKFNDLSVSKYGQDLEYTIKDASGNEISSDVTISLDQLQNKDYVLEVTNLYIDATGTMMPAAEVEEYHLIVSATKTSIDPPKFTNAGTATAIRLVSSKGGDWRPAYTVLTGVSVTYWSASESKVKTVDLSTLYNVGKISSNVWTYTCDDYTLTITGGAVHSDGTTITPVVANNTLYFASTNKAFGTGTTSRNIILTYVFTDKNASTLWNRTETVTYSNLSEYDYNSFKNNGTLTEPSSGGGGTCLAAGTMITLADGTKRAVEDLRKGDKVMSFDHLTGEITCSDVIIVVKTAQENYYKNTFVFNDGTELVTINEHGIFDLDINAYVNIDHENYGQYIGHRFVSVDSAGKLYIKTLVGVDTVRESGFKYDIVTNQTLNYVAEDTLSVTHVLVDVINTFDFGEGLTYDQEKMQADIATYGLYTYDEWVQYCDISVFEQYNIPVMKVGISKGLYTQEYIVGLINKYVLDDSVQIID